MKQNFNALSCQIVDIAYHVPEYVLDNEELAKRYEGWSAEKIFEKTGIKTRHVLKDNEHVSDLALGACQKLFKQGEVDPREVDALILCTQTPDFALPATSFLLHQKLGLRQDCLAFDFNHGCTGFIYGLFIAANMIHSGQVHQALVIFAESYSKWCHPKDKSVSTIFGDGAAAILLKPCEEKQGMGPFRFGSDGSGFEKLTVPASGSHFSRNNAGDFLDKEDQSGNVRSAANLFMDGPELFRFAIMTVPDLVHDLLAQAQLSLDEIDYFVFHQANLFMLENIREIIGIPPEKIIYEFEEVGNTVSASIPIALKKACDKGKIAAGAKLMLVGFGLGYSWGGTILTWGGNSA